MNEWSEQEEYSHGKLPKDNTSIEKAKKEPS
jgi:hypothetical protein